MKTMTCKDLGGACNLEFKANTFKEIAGLSKHHAMEMILKKDQPHLDAMNAMQELMQSPEKMQAWFEDKKRQFDSL